MNNQDQQASNYSMRTQKCRYCHQDIPINSKKCPFCQKTLKMSGCLLSLIIFFIVIGFLIASVIITALLFGFLGTSRSANSDSVSTNVIMESGTEPEEEISNEESQPIEHIVEEYILEIEPTCTMPGIEKGICVECGEEIEREIPPTEHTPSDPVIEVLATFDTNGLIRQRCLICGTVLSEEEYVPSSDERIELYKAECNTYSYSDIIHDPDNYKGEHAKFTGKVVQLAKEKRQSDGSYACEMRVNVTKGEYGLWNDTIYVILRREADSNRIIEDDILTFYGELQGLYSYTAIFGNKITIPQMRAYIYEIN